MVQSAAVTSQAYLAELDPARRAEIEAVRDLVNAAIPPGYVERMAWGMISWEVPLEISGPTYNGQPLVYAALAAQKNHNALYLNCLDVSDERQRRFADAWAAAGKRLDMGKSCLRFKRFGDLELQALRDEIAATTPAQFVRIYDDSRARSSRS